jgi:predicted Zn-dependent protease
VETFRRLVELLPEDIGARADLGIALLRDARLEEALELLGESAAGAPQEPAIRYRYAQALMAAERLEDALAEVNAVLELDPTSSPARADRARLLIATGSAEEGMEELRRYLTEYHGEPLLFLYLAEAQILVDRLSAAAETLATATERFPEDRTLAGARARFLATAPEPSVRDPATALATATRLFEEESTPGNAQLIAMALAASGRFAEAVQWQSQLLERAGAGGTPQWVLDVLGEDLERYQRRELAAFSLLAGPGPP